MGQGKDERKKGSAVASAVVAGASVALGYAALELGLGSVLKPGREAIKESLDPHEDAEARHQASQLVKEVDHDAKVHENTTHSPMPEHKLAASLQHHAAAAGATAPTAPSSS